MQSVRPTRCILFGCGWAGCTWIIQYTLSPRGNDDLWRYLGRFSGVGRSISSKEDEEQGRRCRNDVTSGLSHTTAVIPLITVHYFAFCLAAAWDTRRIFFIFIHPDPRLSPKRPETGKEPPREQGRVCEKRSFDWLRLMADIWFSPGNKASVMLAAVVNKSDAAWNSG